MTIVTRSDYLKHNVYQEIVRRLELAGITKLDRFIASMQKLGPSTLDGIQFTPKNSDGSIGVKDLSSIAAAAVRRSGGKRAFAGGEADSDNKALALSLLATSGTGFREIYYLTDSPRAKMMGPQPDRKFGTLFSFSGMPSDDTSSLHLDLGSSTCNIHIDKAGFVFADSDGKIYLSADAVQHTADELLIKDKLYKIPVIGNVARFVNLSAELQFLRSSVTDSLLSENYVARPLSRNRDLVGTVTIEKALSLGENARVGLRGSLGYNHLGDDKFSVAATGSLEIRFDENRLFR